MGAGLADAALSFPVSLIMSLLNAGNANKQYEDARNTNIEGLNTFLDAMQNSVGQSGSSGRIKIPTLGIDTALPVANMLGELQKYGREGTRRIEMDNAAQMRDYRGYAADAMDRTQALEQNFAPQSQNILEKFSKSGKGIIQGYKDRYGRNMQYLEGAGQQERKDIEADYGRANAAALQGLTSRGLGNSTLLANAQSGNARELADSKGRLNERLRAQRIATDTALSGDVLAAQDSQRRSETDLAGSDLSFRLGLAGNTADAANSLQAGGISMRDAQRRNSTNWTQSIGNQVLNYQNAANQNALNAITGSNFAYPDNTWLQVNQSLGSGAGNNATMNTIENTQHTMMNMAKLSSIMNPFAAVGGSALGGYTGGLGFGAGLRSGGGGGSSPAQLGTP